MRKETLFAFSTRWGVLVCLPVLSEPEAVFGIVEHVRVAVVDVVLPGVLVGAEQGLPAVAALHWPERWQQGRRWETPRADVSGLPR